MTPPATVCRKPALSAASRAVTRCLFPLLIAASWAVLSLLASPLPASAQPADRPAVALHYGARPPIDELRAFDWVVLEPQHVADVARLPSGTQWFAYTSVGEIDPRRPYAAAVPPAWLRGDNSAWGSRLVDHTAAGWAEFFASRVIAPRWAQGWRGFFLDTLDSHRLFARTPEAQRAQEDALVAAIELLHQRFPGIRLVANRGFEILPRLKGRVQGVVAESLFRGWDASSQRYVEVSDADRAWLLSQLQTVQREHRVPVVAIDYVAPAERALARDTAARIRAAGFVPWVTSGAIDMLGVGDLEVQPRRVLLVTDLAADTDMQQTAAYRYLALPLHWLGYVIDAIDVRAPLPELDPGRHAAIVTWFSQPVSMLNPRWLPWLKQQRDRGLRLVMLHEPGVEPDAPLARELGFRAVAPRGALTEVTRPRWVGFEAPPPLAAGVTQALRWEGSADDQQRLRLRAADGSLIDGAAITPWGGFAVEPFALRMPALASQARWIIDPIEFLRRALAQPDFPVPDVSTEAGRRLLLVHIDGDGFVSRAERVGSPFAGEVMLTDVLMKRKIPHTVSVIQGEIAGNGMFAQLSPALEDIARRIFALPHVELASHSYSHPFFWRRIADPKARGAYKGEAALNLLLPGYQFDLRAEIPGSVEYIDARLAPPGKRTQVFLWTGDTAPTAEAVKLADASGLLNMNGGDTLITRSEPTISAASGYGLLRGPVGEAALQVFAPNQNENLYTNNWTGPFYGFQRVIETFELTGAPLRLKPVNIYYHTYSATKTASLAALNRVYDWAQAQPLVPVYASDYIRKVIDFHSMAIARDWRSAEPSWRVRGGGELRTLRIGADAPVSLSASRQLAGVAPGPRARYLHLADEDAHIVLAPEAATSAAPVHVREATGWISEFSRSAAGIRFALHGYTTPSFTLAGAAGCRVRIDGKDSTPQRRDPQAARDPRDARAERDLQTHELQHADPGPAPRRHLVDVRCSG